MSDPYKILGVERDADDQAIRMAYLAKTQEFRPESHPKEFAAVRAAFELIRELDDRVRHRLFTKAEPDAIQSILEELSATAPRRRLTLESLVKAALPK